MSISKDQTKTIGVVIPIYNVEKYLKECLDSVINQTYTNLEIILVNDGSTDENSLSIAKEYTLKDKRITLIDKKNGGLSSARNVGIEYFSGEYKLKNKTKSLKENSLIEFEIEGNNPYEIYTVYKSYKFFKDNNKLLNFKTPDIDYIIFLDSDDYWELNCIEECVPRMDGVEVVWFDAKTFLDGVNHNDWKSNIKWLNFSQECIISRNDWLKRMYDYKLSWFYFSVMGLVDFLFLMKIKLKFIDYIVQEDDYFGILLFSQIKHCYILPQEFYNYRIRQSSIMSYDGVVKKENIPQFFYKYLKEFNGNALTTKAYFHVSSHVKTCIALLNFFKEQNNEMLFNSFITYLLPTYIKNAYEIVHFGKDPLNLLDNVEEIKGLMDKYHIKPHGVEFRFKNEAAYKIGNLILTDSRSLKKLCKLPIKIHKIIKENKAQHRLLKQNAIAKPYLVLPKLHEYEDAYKIDALKQHLSYKIGLAFLQTYKFYIFGYIVFLFKFLKILLLKRMKSKTSKVNTHQAPESSKLDTRLSHMHWELTRIREICEQRLANINYELYHLRLFYEKSQKKEFKEDDLKNKVSVLKCLRLPLDKEKQFLEMLWKKSLFIDMTSNYLEYHNAFKTLENIDICTFEVNPFRFALIQKEKLKNLRLFDFLLDTKTDTKKVLFQDELNAHHILASNFNKLTNSHLIETKSVFEFLDEISISIYDFSVLNLELNFETFEIIKIILERNLHLQFTYLIVFCTDQFHKEILYYELVKELRVKNVDNFILAEG